MLTDIENGGVNSTPVAVRKFAKYITDREKTVLRKLIRNLRRKAMSISNKSVPRRLYSKQSETVSSILAAKKCALGYGKKEYVSKFSFIKDIYQSAVEHQSREIEKAIITQSNEYRLNENAAYLHVVLETWENWTCEKKQRYTAFVRDLNLDDIKVKKVINSSFWEVDEVSNSPILNFLSTKLSEHLPSILHADIIERKGLDLLNNPVAISLSPSITISNTEKVYLVAGKSSKIPDKLIVTEQGLVKCDCKGFRYLSLYSHSVAISQKEGSLSLHIGNVKKSQGKNRSRSATSYPTLAKGAGRKGEQKRRERAYSHHGTNESPAQSPFTEIWHNNHSLVICSVSKVPLNKNQCGYCGKEFLRGPLAIVPFNIVIKYKERWQYLNRNRTSELDLVYLPSSLKTPTTHFYCIRTK